MVDTVHDEDEIGGVNVHKIRAAGRVDSVEKEPIEGLNRNVGSRCGKGAVGPAREIGRNIFPKQRKKVFYISYGVVFYKRSKCDGK